jgi:hypothetical protein
MNCRSINKLLFLKPDELSKKEMKKLSSHLENCSNCWVEREEIKKAYGVMSGINKLKPVEVDSPFFEEEILRSIEELTGKKSKSEELINAIVGFLSKSQIRFVLSALLVFIFGFYFFEESSMVSGISRLEKNTSESFSSEVISSGVLDNQIKVLNVLPELYDLINRKKNYAELSENWILINKSGLKEILQLYDKLISARLNLRPDYESRYPLLVKFLSKGLNEKSVNELLLQKNEIQIELDKLLKDGGVLNENKK